MANSLDEIKVYTITWYVDEDGYIAQSLHDMMDPEISIFNETAKDHNQAIHNAIPK